jgi:chromosome partitioning protein
MIVAFLNQKGGVGKTTLGLHVAGAWAAQGKRVVVIDADPQGSALDWFEQRAKEGSPRLFGVLGLARDTLHVEAPEIARDVHHVLIDGSPGCPHALRVLAADLRWCQRNRHRSTAGRRGKLRLLQERDFPPMTCKRGCPEPLRRPHRDCARRRALANHEPPVLASTSVSARFRRTPPRRAARIQCRAASQPHARWPRSPPRSKDRATRAAVPGVALSCGRVIRTHGSKPTEHRVEQRQGRSVHRAADDRRHPELRSRIKPQPFGARWSPDAARPQFP